MRESPSEYLELFGEQSDRRWSEIAGVTHEQLFDVARNTLTDGEVYNWVRIHVVRTEADRARFEARKRDYGLAGCNDIQTRADLIDADEGRLP